MKDRIIKYFAGELNEDERLEFLLNVRNDDDLKKEYIFYRNIRGILSFVSHPDDCSNADIDYHNFKHNKNKKKHKPKLYFRIINYAALAAVLILGTWLGFYFHYKENIHTEITYNTISVPVGQRASVVLSDGTEVWLNAKSQLKYPSRFENDERKVELIGEAYFDVAKDKKRKFIVSTSKLNIKVLGTMFNVEDYLETEQAHVDLIEGSVELYTGETSSQKFLLEPMQSFNYTEGAVHISDNVDLNDFLWRQGIYHFNNVSLAEIAKKLELYYDVKIIAHDPQILEVEYTGKFRQQDGIYEILTKLQKIQEFTIEKDNANNTYILK